MGGVPGSSRSHGPLGWTWESGPPRWCDEFEEFDASSHGKFMHHIDVVSCCYYPYYYMYIFYVHLHMNIEYTHVYIYYIWSIYIQYHLHKNYQFFSYLSLYQGLRASCSMRIRPRCDFPRGPFPRWILGCRVGCFLFVKNLQLVGWLVGFTIDCLVFFFCFVFFFCVCVCVFLWGDRGNKGWFLASRCGWLRFLKISEVVDITSKRWSKSFNYWHDSKKSPTGHTERTLKKPEYLIALSRNLLNGVRW